MDTKEQSIKKLLLEALERTGDKPEDVRCMFSRRWPDRQSGPMPTMPQSSAADLPEGELSVLFAYSKKYVYTLDKLGNNEITIKTSTDVDQAKTA
ncbi:MAG: hypothetical protein ACE1ZI_00820 [Acidobacteriota bacterium]